MSGTDDVARPEDEDSLATHFFSSHPPVALELTVEPELEALLEPELELRRRAYRQLAARA